MTASNLRPQLRSALLRQIHQKTSSKRSWLTKGFTLVELMVVIVIIGILSAVALPQFLGLKDRAKINTQIAEGSGLAKECAAAIISDGPYPADYAAVKPKQTVTGLTISGHCNTAGANGAAATAPTATSVTYTTEALPAPAAGTKCGQTSMAAGKTCVITVDNDANKGQISYSVP